MHCWIALPIGKAIKLKPEIFDCGCCQHVQHEAKIRRMVLNQLTKPRII